VTDRKEGVYGGRLAKEADQYQRTEKTIELAVGGLRQKEKSK